MRLHALGNGTAMAKAIRQAVADIGAMPQLAGTEILIITDGACALNEQEIRAMLGGAIAINTVKIGHTQLYASKSFIRDKLFEDDTAQHKVIASLQSKEREFQRLRERAESPASQRRYDESLRSVRAELNRQVDAMTEEIVVGYGHELERLSEIYLTVDDIDLLALLPEDGSHIAQLRAMYNIIAGELADAESMDLLRKLTLLHDHIALLLEYSPEGPQRSQLEALRREVEGRLEALLNRDEDFAHPGVLQHISAEDRHDIQFLLSASNALTFSSWGMLFKLLYRKLRRWLKRG
jgi:hypothetical protein